MVVDDGDVHFFLSKVNIYKSRVYVAGLRTFKIFISFFFHLCSSLILYEEQSFDLFYVDMVESRCCQILLVCSPFSIFKWWIKTSISWNECFHRMLAKHEMYGFLYSMEAQSLLTVCEKDIERVNNNVVMISSASFWCESTSVFTV